MRRLVFSTLVIVALFIAVGADAGCTAPTTFTPYIDPAHGGTTIYFGGQTNCTGGPNFTYVRLVVEIRSRTFWGWSYPIKTLLKEQTQPNITLNGTIPCIAGTLDYAVSTRVDWQEWGDSYYNVSQNFGTFTCPNP